MAHPAGSELRSRTVATPQRVHKFSDQALLLDEEAVLSKHQMMEGQAVEIELLKEQEEQRGSERLYFRDGKRLIDFVLAFETPADADDQKEEEKEKQRELAEKRKVFEENLQKAGLELEHEDEITTKVSLESTLFAFYNRMQKIVGKINARVLLCFALKMSSTCLTNTWIYLSFRSRSMLQLVGQYLYF